MLYDEKLGVWHEKGTSQLQTFQEKDLSSYTHVDFKDKRVLDIGACAGSFSKLAFDRGAKEVIAVEPHPINIKVFKKNAPTATLIEAAVVPSSYEGSSVEFYVSPSNNLTISSTAIPKKLSSRNVQLVEAVKFEDLLEKYRPQVLKIDIEGAEFDLLSGMRDLPNYIEEFVCEFHIFMQKDRTWQWWHDILYVLFDTTTWKLVRRPEWPKYDRCMRKFHGFNVNVMGWKRRAPNHIKKIEE